MRTLVLGLLCLAAAAPAAAQRRASGNAGCQVRIDTVGGAQHFLTASDGTQIIFMAGGILASCANQPTTVISSDSLAYFQASNMVDFVGHVNYRDSTGTLIADKMTYYSRVERLYAVGNVYTKNRSSGTEMRGPNLDLYRAAPGVRDTQELTATQRPIITFVPTGANVTTDTLNPFVIVADRVYMKHTDRMWGSGSVVINRRDLFTTSDSAALQLGDSLGLLIGTPVVTGYDTTKVGPPRPMFRVDTTRLTGRRVRLDTVRFTAAAQLAPPDSAVTYRLKGQRIRFDLTGRQKIRRVLSSGDADATGPAWHLASDTLDMAIDSGQIQRAQAWGREKRAVAVSGLNTITADSLDIQMPKQVMRQVWAYGNSRATSKADSTWVEDDWMSGDSLQAIFADRVDSVTARVKSEIQRVTSYGTARAYYHTENQHDPHGERGINYSRGDRINIAMHEGKVRTVDIAGKVDGVYLEPLPPGSDSLADSTATDSTGARGSGLGTRDSAAVRSVPTTPPAPRPSAPAPRPEAPMGFIPGTRAPGPESRAPSPRHD